MSVRKLTVEEFNAFKDGMVTELIADWELAISLLGYHRTHKVVHAFAFLLDLEDDPDPASCVSFYVVADDDVYRYTFEFYMDGSILKNIPVYSLTGRMEVKHPLI